MSVAAHHSTVEILNLYKVELHNILGGGCMHVNARFVARNLNIVLESTQQDGDIALHLDRV